MSVIAEAEPRQWVVVVYDRDGGIINEPGDEFYESEAEALKAGNDWVDDLRYGSHEAEVE